MVHLITNHWLLTTASEEGWGWKTRGGKGSGVARVGGGGRSLYWLTNLRKFISQSPKAQCVPCTWQNGKHSHYVFVKVSRRAKSLNSFPLPLTPARAWYIAHSSFLLQFKYRFKRSHQINVVKFWRHPLQEPKDSPQHLVSTSATELYILLARCKFILFALFYYFLFVCEELACELQTYFWSSLPSLYPGYQSFFLACDGELRFVGRRPKTRARPETALEKPLAPRGLSLRKKERNDDRKYVSAARRLVRSG